MGEGCDRGSNDDIGGRVVEADEAATLLLSSPPHDDVPAPDDEDMPIVASGRGTGWLWDTCSTGCGGAVTFNSGGLALGSEGIEFLKGDELGAIIQQNGITWKPSLFP